MEEQLPSDKPAQEVKPDIKAEMKAFVEAEAKKAEKQEDEVLKEPQKPEDEPENPDEDSEEQKKEEEDTEEPKKEDEEKKRPNRYQKLKAKSEALQVQVKKLTTDLHEAIRIGHLLAERNKAFVQKYNDDFAKFQKGQQITDADHENWVLKAKEEERKKDEALRKQHEAEQAKAEILAEKQQMVVDYQIEAMSLAKKYGLSGDEQKAFARKVLLHTAVANKAGDTVTIEQVAQELAPLIKRKQVDLEKEQLKVNGTAPKTLTKGTGRVPNYEISGKSDDEQKATMKAFLGSIGIK